MGAHLNAYTSREQTVYYAKLFRKDVDVGMEILGDILQNSLLDSGAVDRERDVILREMEEVNKQHEELILDLLHESAYVGGGLGRTILGPEENIKTLKSKDLRSYIDTHYTAPRMVVAAAGALDHGEVVRLAEEHWSGRPTTSSTDFPVDFDWAVFTPTEVRNEDLSEPRAHVALAFDGAEWTSPYSVPLMVLQTPVLGGDVGEGALNVCKAFPDYMVNNPAKPEVKVCGTGIMMTVYLLGRCGEGSLNSADMAHTWEIGCCDAGLHPKTCEGFDAVTDPRMGAAQSYKITQC